jgi:hypothetical protein
LPIPRVSMAGLSMVSSRRTARRSAAAPAPARAPASVTFSCTRARLWGALPDQAPSFHAAPCRAAPAPDNALARISQGFAQRSLQASLWSAHAEVDGVLFVVQGRKLQVKLSVTDLARWSVPQHTLMLKVNIVYSKNGETVGRVETDKEPNLDVITYKPSIDIAKVRLRGRAPCACACSLSRALSRARAHRLASQPAAAETCKSATASVPSRPRVLGAAGMDHDRPQGERAQLCAQRRAVPL